MQGYSEKDNLKTLLQASYEPTKQADKTLQKAGYTLDKSLSNMNTKVFTDAMGKPHITFRGSRHILDWVRDDPLIALGLGRFAPRVQQAKEITKKVESKYGKEADVFGNSLGGALAEMSGAHGKIVTHNKAVAITDIGKTISKNQKDIRTLNDPVSLLSLTQKHKGRFVNTMPVSGLVQAHLYTALPDKFLV
jgi:hypothetical protein